MRETVGHALDALEDAAEILLNLDRTRLTPSELVDELARVETVRRKFDALSNRQLAEITERGVA